jgi:hypothetical protein
MRALHSLDYFDPRRYLEEQEEESLKREHFPLARGCGHRFNFLDHEMEFPWNASSFVHC